MDTLLGKKVAVPQCYAPEVLQRLPRTSEKHIGAGVDVWHLHEFSVLTDAGLPVGGQLKLTIPHSSAYLVESKSLKLYGNSLNMCRLGSTPEQAVKEAVRRIRYDLEKLLVTQIGICFYPYNCLQSSDDFEGFSLLEEQKGVESVCFDSFSPRNTLLQMSAGANTSHYYTHLFRTNCPYTQQPDWATVYISWEAVQGIEPLSLLSFLISFRTEEMFHETTCVRLYQSLYDFLQPARLMVACIYSRRGGIDIFPVRASDASILPYKLTRAEYLTPFIR